MQIVPFDNREGYIWYNGEFVNWQEAKIHVLNHGLHYASCVFEGIRSYNGKIFKLQEHMERLHNSAQLIGFTLPYSVETLIDANNILLLKQNLTDAYIRPFAWRGSERMTISAPNNSVNVAIACWNWPKAYYENKNQGIKLAMAEWVRPPANSFPCNSKASGGYVIATLSKQKAEEQGCNDALMLDSKGYIAETTSSNIFFVKDNELHTPIADSFLNGITRLTIIELAKANGINVVERRIFENELQDFTEVFVTGTSVEVTGVIQIAKHNYSLGPITQLLIQKYTELTTM